MSDNKDLLIKIGSKIYYGINKSIVEFQEQFMEEPKVIIIPELYKIYLDAYFEINYQKYIEKIDRIYNVPVIWTKRFDVIRCY
jgi:hypothetical protein